MGNKSEVLTLEQCRARCYTDAEREALDQRWAAHYAEVAEYLARHPELKIRPVMSLEDRDKRILRIGAKLFQLGSAW